MKNDTVTPVGGPRVVPVVYVDLDTVYGAFLEYRNADATFAETDAALQAAVSRYPGLKAAVLTKAGPAGGNPIYRYEAPLPVLYDWLLKHYCDGDHADTGELVKGAYLAR